MSGDSLLAGQKQIVERKSRTMPGITEKNTKTGYSQIGGLGLGVDKSRDPHSEQTCASRGFT